MAVVDLGAAQREHRHALAAMRRAGFTGTMGEAIAAIGHNYVRDHKHFERLLTEAGPKLRQELYDALVPHLRFRAKPLDVYVASAGQMAEREQLPVMDQNGMLHEFRPAQDVSSVQKQVEGLLAEALAERTLILRCGKCTRIEKFFGTEDETKVAVITKARRAGWVYDNSGEDPAEICPECFTPLREAHESFYGKPSKVINA